MSATVSDALSGGVLAPACAPSCAVANGRIAQSVEVVADGDEGKRRALCAALEEALEEEGARALVFVSSKRRADELSRALRTDGWPALCLHGDKAQPEREWVLHEFKTGAQPLLVATDVAQRGLDIPQVRCVINYDCPATGEAYVHRIGRSGRAGAHGAARTLLTPDDARVAPDIVRVLRATTQPVPEALERLAAQTQWNRR